MVPATSLCKAVNHFKITIVYYIANRPYFEQKGLPVFLDRTYTEKFNTEKPMEPIYSGEWARYNRHQDSAPLPERMRLPAQLILVCKGLRSFQADFFSDEPMQWIVSERFLKFLQERELLAVQYEQSRLEIVSTGNKPITNQAYFLLRLLSSSNDLIDFAQSPQVISRHKPLSKTAPRKIYYTDFVFYKEETPAFLVIDDRAYWYTFLCNSEIKQAIEGENFLGFDFYKLVEYMQEMEHRAEKPSLRIYKSVLS